MIEYKFLNTKSATNEDTSYHKNTEYCIYWTNSKHFHNISYTMPIKLYFFGFAILRPRLTVIIHISLLLTQHCMVGLSELAPYIVNESAHSPCLFHVTGMFNPTPLYLNIFDKTEGKNQK